MAEATTETAAPVDTTTTAAATEAGKTTEATTEAGATLAETAGGEEKEVAVQATWPDDWRNRMAGKDEATLKRLGRFTSPENVFKSFLQLEKKLSSGEAKPGLPEKPTPEQLAEYRKANGIPEKADDYFSNLDDVKIREQDKPALMAFAERMHTHNTPPAVVKDAVKWYYETVSEQQALMAEQDAEYRAEAEQALRQEWGDKFKGNIRSGLSLLDGAPAELKNKLLGARLANGRSFGDDPDALRWLASLAHEINPASTVVPGTGAAAGKTLSDEIAGIEKLMADRSSEYWKGPGANAMQARYRDLISARDKATSRAA